MLLSACLLVFFFFKQKTAYEIVSRDWSSDVCSSDLLTVSGSPSTGQAPDAIGIDPPHRFAYVVGSSNGIGPGSVSQYVLNAGSGALTFATFSSTGATSGSNPISTGVNPLAIAIDHNGMFVFVANH